jgi:hypothetical protein
VELTLVAAAGVHPTSRTAIGLQGDGTEVEKLMRALRLIPLMLVTIPLAGCELVGNIFQAGMWVGVVMVVLLVAIVGGIAMKLRG